MKSLQNCLRWLMALLRALSRLPTFAKASWINKFYMALRQRRDVRYLTIAFLLLVAATFDLKINIKRDIYSYLFVVDISQSMNTMDTTLNGKTVSRLASTQALLHRVVAELSCGTQVSLALFAGSHVAALYTPIEVCENFALINDTITHFDWRSAWAGNSRLRSSLISLAKTLRSFNQAVRVVFLTDGEETPRLHVFNRTNLAELQGVSDWLFVGMGGFMGTPIPKYDEKNQLIGYWANDSFAMQPGVAQISAENLGVRDEKVATGASDRYLSRLDESYLKSLANEVNGFYVRADNPQAVLAAMRQQQPSRRDWASFELRWLLAALAGVMLALIYWPQRRSR